MRTTKVSIHKDQNVWHITRIKSTLDNTSSLGRYTLRQKDERKDSETTCYSDIHTKTRTPSRKPKRSNIIERTQFSNALTLLQICWREIKNLIKWACIHRKRRRTCSNGYKSSCRNQQGKSSNQRADLLLWDHIPLWFYYQKVRYAPNTPGAT